MLERLPLLLDQKGAKSFNEINLTRHDDCCPLYLELLLRVVNMSLQSRHRMDVGTKFLREYVRRKPEDLPMAATLANLVREAGEFEFAAQLTSRVLAHLSEAPPQLQAEEHRLRYDLGCSLSVLDRNSEAFAQANAINIAGGGEPLELKIELVKIIGNSLKFQQPLPSSPLSRSSRENPNRSFTLQLELQVRREAVRLQPHSTGHLWDLGALLCRLGSPEQLEEGIAVYSRALQAALACPVPSLINSIQHGLQAGIATRDSNLADGRHGRVLGGDSTEMYFIDSSFIEGVDYALFFSEDAALAFQAKWQAEHAVATAAAPQPPVVSAGGQQDQRFWLFNLRSVNLEVWNRRFSRAANVSPRPQEGSAAA